MQEASRSASPEAKDIKDKKLPATARYGQAFRSVMDQVGSAPLKWVKQKLERHRASKDAERILEDILPIRLKDIGMRGMVQVPSITGRYIVHIGQIHSESDATRDFLSPQTAVSQKAIERLIIEGNISEVFEEGIFEDIEHIDGDLERIRNLELTRDFVRVLPSILSKAAKFQEDRLFSVYKYAFRRKIEAFLQICVEQGWEKERAKAQEALRILSMEDMIIDPYKEVGGARIAQAKGRVKIYSAEDREAHAKGNELARDIRLIRNEIFEEFVKDPHSQKIPELKQKFDKAEQDFRTFDHSERENIAIKKIISHSSFIHSKVAYLVYGAAHDFTAAVQQHNQQNPNKQVGLIYISDRETFNEK